MKFTRVVFAFVLMAIMLPAAASAKTACASSYYGCLNDSWNTSGFERYMANIECGVAYMGCLRRLA